MVSVAPFRWREITGISCRLQSNGDTDIFNVVAEKPAICGRNWFMKKARRVQKTGKINYCCSNKYCLYVMSIAVVQRFLNFFSRGDHFH